MLDWGGRPGGWGSLLGRDPESGRDGARSYSTWSSRFARLTTSNTREAAEPADRDRATEEVRTILAALPVAAATDLVRAFRHVLSAGQTVTELVHVVGLVVADRVPTPVRRGALDSGPVAGGVIAAHDGAIWKSDLISSLYGT